MVYTNYAKPAQFKCGEKRLRALAHVMKIVCWREVALRISSHRNIFALSQLVSSSQREAGDCIGLGSALRHDRRLRWQQKVIAGCVLLDNARSAIANTGAIAASSAQGNCKLHSTWSRSHGHRKLVAIDCAANRVQLLSRA